MFLSDLYVLLTEDDVFDMSPNIGDSYYKTVVHQTGRSGRTSARKRSSSIPSAHESTGSFCPELIPVLQT